MKYVVRMYCVLSESGVCDWEGVVSEAQQMPLLVLLDDPCCPAHPGDALWLEVIEEEEHHGDTNPDTTLS